MISHLDHVLDSIEQLRVALLQQTRYRKVLTPLLQTLQGLPLAAWPPYGASLLALVEFFLAPPVGGSGGFKEKIALRLVQFQEARSLLSHWERTLKGHRQTKGPEVPLLAHYRRLKAQLPSHERTDYFQHAIFATDPFFQAFRRFKALLDEICTDRRFKALLRQYNTHSGIGLYFF